VRCPARSCVNACKGTALSSITHCNTLTNIHREAASVFSLSTNPDLDKQDNLPKKREVDLPVEKMIWKDDMERTAVSGKPGGKDPSSIGMRCCAHQDELMAALMQMPAIRYVLVLIVALCYCLHVTFELGLSLVRSITLQFLPAGTKFKCAADPDLGVVFALEVKGGKDG